MNSYLDSDGYPTDSDGYLVDSDGKALCYEFSEEEDMTDKEERLNVLIGCIERDILELNVKKDIFVTVGGEGLSLEWAKRARSANDAKRWRLFLTNITPGASGLLVDAPIRHKVKALSKLSELIDKIKEERDAVQKLTEEGIAMVELVFVHADKTKPVPPEKKASPHMLNVKWGEIRVEVFIEPTDLCLRRIFKGRIRESSFYLKHEAGRWSAEIVTSRVTVRGSHSISTNGAIENLRVEMAGMELEISELLDSASRGG